MKNLSHKSYIIVFGLIFAVIFCRWFTMGQIIGGDWPFLFDEALREFSLPVPVWHTWFGNGLGGITPVFSLQIFNNFTTSLAYFFNIPWVAVYKIFWFGLFIFLSITSSICLVNSILSRLNIWQKLTASLVFSTNTYVLIVVGGGQMGVALSYAVAPLVIARFIKLIDCLASSNKNFQFPLLGGQAISNFRLALLAGLALSLQVMFDPRIAYITMIAVAIYMILNFKNILNAPYLILYTFIIPVVLSILLHAVWILPILILKQSSLSDLGSAYTGIGMVKFLSFASFSQSLSLLHSNWPDNIFGKTGFMKPEFLAIPIFAYVSLFFVGKQKNINKVITFFAVLGIVGAFLAKGANPPFGNIYLWLFENIPGLVMFRDPTKFYLLIALSYSILIPFSIYSVSGWFNSKFKSKNYLSIILLIFFLGYWIFTIYPAIVGQLGGTFKNHEVPKEYALLKDFLYKQPEFFRTLWIPRQQRFSFFSTIHPSVEAIPLFNATNSAEVLQKLGKEGSTYLSELSIKYVIVPYDSMGEIFQKERKYDEASYKNVVNELKSITWLKEVGGFGKIKVFETPLMKDHLWLMGDGLISYKMVSSTHYLVSVSLVSSQKLIFSERYNPSWVVKIKNKTIKSQKTLNNLNSFELEKGDYSLEIIFLQDGIYNFGRTISFAAFLGILFFIFKYRRG